MSVEMETIIDEHDAGRTIGPCQLSNREGFCSLTNGVRQDQMAECTGTVGERENCPLWNICYYMGGRR